MLNELKVLTPPGLRPIKQVELYSKWAPIMPKWAADITCPKPSDEVMKSVRAEKTSKAAAKRKAKRTTTGQKNTSGVRSTNESEGG